MSYLPAYAPRSVVTERLPLIFPEGTPNRVYCTRELAASTVFTAIYIGAVEGGDRFLGPVHVYRMTEEQAARAGNMDRTAYAEAIRKKQPIHGTRWYADNTREPIRDETLREGLVAVGAVGAKDAITTSGTPRYFLKRAFADLFDLSLTGAALEQAIIEFQAKHLSKSALARVSIVRAGAAGSAAAVNVTLPNQSVRQLSPGPSSVITKAVIEVFAPRFLATPAVLWISESGNKVVFQDAQLARKLGLQIQADRNLPDIILADLGPQDPLLVFAEAVASDGAVTDRKQAALIALTDAAGFKRAQVAFLTAYQDRGSPGFKKTISELAWGSFAWFVSEPAGVLVMRDGGAKSERLSDLMGAR